MDRRIRTSFIAIATDATLITIKATLATITGSVALAADAYHSLSDFLVSISVLLGLVLRKRQEKKALLNEAKTSETDVETTQASENTEEKQADRKSEKPEKEKAPPGYWIESIVAYVVSLAILYIPYEIITTLNQAGDPSLQYSWLAIIGVVICIAVTYFISRFKIIVGKETDSPGLRADGYHSRADMFTSFAVLLSILGQHIGIKLDPLVAVIIAVLIGITGLELFFTSLISFVNKSKIKELKIWTWIFTKLDSFIGFISEKVIGKRFSVPSLKVNWQKVADYVLRPKFIVSTVLVLLAVYLSYGFTVINPNETGVKLRFGKAVDDNMKPGLHYVFPWPVESLMRVEANRVYRVEVGFRTDENMEGGLTSLLWETRHAIQGYTKLKGESVALTGDENLIDISLIVHYRPTNPTTHLLKVRTITETIRGLAESNLRYILATNHSEEIVSGKRINILNAIRDKLIEDSKTLDLGVEILSVFCHDIHPPLDVIRSFRDVFSAREDKARLSSEAESHRNEALPKARAESVKRQLEAEAFSFEKLATAEGDALKFKLTSSAYRKSPDVTGYRLFVETVEKGLKGKKKIIADPEANRGGYRMWMFSPNKTPFDSGSSPKGR